MCHTFIACCAKSIVILRCCQPKIAIMLKLNACLLIAFSLSLYACNNESPKNNSAKKDSTTTVAAGNYDWALLPFVKEDASNPVLTPGDGEFMCPILRKKIKWEQKDVFNPAVVVKDGKV